MASSENVSQKTFTATDASQLASALKLAHGGDTILVSGSNFGDVSINKISATSTITIRSADAGNPAVFASIKAANSANLTFDNVKVDFTPNDKTVAWNSAVSITDSKKITFVNSTIEGGPAVNGVSYDATVLDATGNVIGLPAGRGVTIVRSSEIEISGNDISEFHKGIVVSQVTDLKIAGNEIHNLRTTPISGADVSNVVIDGNHLYNSSPWRLGGTGDHGDFIHFWTSPSTQDAASANIKIVNNFLDQGTEQALLGIYLDDNGNKLGFTGVEIRNNVISNDDAQAIRLENVKGAVTNNTLIQPDAYDYHTVPGVIATDGSNIILSGNLLGRVTVQAGSVAAQSNNMVITRLDAASPGYYDKLLVNARTDDPTLADLVSKVSAVKPGLGADLSKLPAIAWETRVANTISVGTSISDKVSAATKATLGTITKPATGSGAQTDTPVVLNGTDGADSLRDAKGHNELRGGRGDDKYVVTFEDTVVVEQAGEGTDTVFSSVDFKIGSNIENLTLSGDALVGTGNELDNSLRGSDKGNILSGAGGDDWIIGGSGQDFIYGGTGNDRLLGGDGGDAIYGDDGNDTIFGEDGADRLFGGAGNDQLTGGAGQDIMTGGSGSDRFVFGTGDFSGVERITDFSSLEGDKIALNGIDGNVLTVVREKFSFIGTLAFNGTAGQLRYESVGNAVMVSGDTNGDRIADFQIQLDNVSKLSVSDFIL